jgi:hypothetical protein
VAIQSRPRSCCTKRLLPRTRIAVEDTDEHNGDSTSDKKYGREYGPLNNQFHKRLKSNGFCARMAEGEELGSNLLRVDERSEE